MTRNEARLKACQLLQEAARTLLELPAAETTGRVHFVVAEIDLCWKHVRDIEVGDPDRRPD